MELIPLKPFTEQLKTLCHAQVVDAIKKLEAYSYIEKDRGLLPYEKGMKNSYYAQLKTNEKWLEHIDPEYLKVC